MKVTKVIINNMHNVTSATYDLGNINYATGPNGAGKSTVLQAIQLALLGYIPGYPKKNSDIMKHSNNGMMSVEIQFDNGYMIRRTYTRKKTTVSCDVITIPEDLDVASLTSQLSNITFDFGSFLSKSANEQKKWFISFLSKAFESSTNTVDIDEELNNTLEALGVETDVHIRNNVRQYLDVESCEDGLQYVKDIESSIKEGLSYEKGVQQSLQNTLNTLVLYEDVSSMKEEDIINELDILRDRKSQLSEIQKEVMAYEYSCKQLQQFSNLADTLELDKQYSILKEQESELKNNIDRLNADIQQVVSAQATLREECDEFKSSKLTTIECDIQNIRSLANGSGMCPYSKKMCDDVKIYIEEASKKLDELKDTYTKNKQEYENMIQSLKSMAEDESHSRTTLNDVMSKLSAVKNDMNAISLQYQARDNQKRNLPKKPESNMTYEEVSNQISFVADQIEIANINLGKIQSNAKYNELKEKIDKDMTICDFTVKALNSLKTRFGSNGLQQEVMERPFEKLIDSITTYLQKTFGTKSIKAYFELSEKSNSFEFGFIRNDAKVPFEVLSSGEKCVYMLALQSSLVDKSEDLKLIILDDVFDHVDTHNIERCIKAAKKFKNIQYVFATFNEIENMEDVNVLNIGK